MMIEEFRRGDDRVVHIDVTDNGQPYLWDGSRCWFTLKRRWQDTDAEAIMIADSDDGTVDISADGIALAQIDGTKTATLPNKQQTIHYDVQIKNQAGKVFTVAAGDMIVLPEATHAR